MRRVALLVVAAVSLLFASSADAAPKKKKSASVAAREPTYESAKKAQRAKGTRKECATKGGKRRCKRVAMFQGHNAAKSTLRTDPHPKPTGDIWLRAENLAEEAKVNIYKPDGTFDDAALAQLDDLFRCRQTGEVRAVRPELYEQLSRFSDHFGGKKIVLVSGFRFAERNSSRHFHALAMLVVYNGKLIGTESSAYDATCSQSKSAWVSSLNFTNPSVPYSFSSNVTPRIIGGVYMAPVPPEWQSAFGGKVISGNDPWSIISCGSPGPALFTIDADALTNQPAANSVINSIPLVYYVENSTQASLGHWNSNDPNQTVNGKKIPSVTVTNPKDGKTYSIAYEDNSMRIYGVLFPDGTRSVLFFGSKGLGPYCYGTGSECNDPRVSSSLACCRTGRPPRLASVLAMW